MNSYKEFASVIDSTKRKVEIPQFNFVHKFLKFNVGYNRDKGKIPSASTIEHLRLHFMTKNRKLILTSMLLILDLCSNTVSLQSDAASY